MPGPHGTAHETYPLWRPCFCRVWETVRHKAKATLTADIINALEGKRFITVIDAAEWIYQWRASTISFTGSSGLLEQRESDFTRNHTRENPFLSDNLILPYPAGFAPEMERHQ
ncbi:hypothetical protein PAAG_07302 [Paracoccidioides lutzii Pb01]|uniref:Uncharacterized protein n=1 Tax=Paracoccidioides lutzii (strain ATCC MYA-826 / Pb01) TaxID=502779 RepID=C1H961_PARBA|nr:hypothetical protein PAAG_07302 [Paracoccidioides lutzii Pb01]EEH36884.1 hypothetical protein PAAG_07302 [Paracoccidioides lutzii Pb01]